MGNLRFVVLCLVVAACGSDKATPVDAAIDSPRPIDAKVFMDAPPPEYDLSCYGMTPGTAVDATITVSGQTATVSQSGTTAVGNIEVSVYKVGANTASATVTSATTGSVGAFTTGAITTNGVALEHLKAADLRATPAYRTTYLYPPYPLRATIDSVPVLMFTDSLVEQLAILGGEQNDTDNGMLVVLVNDCSLTMPSGIGGADIVVKQNNVKVGGNPIDLGAVFPQAAGTYFVLNVPDGAAEITVTYDGKAFPTKTVVAHKKPSGAGAMGTVTATAIPPGPIL